LHLDKIPGTFDYFLAEAILTMQSPQGKAKVLTEIHNRLKPGGKFLSHELLANDKETEISADLAKVIKVNSTSLSAIHWIQAFTQAGLQVQKYETAAMSLLNCWRML
jgi:SAM-dependent methyltransferase